MIIDPPIYRGVLSIYKVEDFKFVWMQNICPTAAWATVISAITTGTLMHFPHTFPIATSHYESLRIKSLKSVFFDYFF